MKTFAEQWPLELHSEPNQVERRLRGEKIKADDISIDSVSQSAVMWGSGAHPYSVTLTSCTCPDFVHSYGPCKHIYRLASELGELPTLPIASVARQQAARNAADADLARWRAEFEDGTIPPKEYAALAAALKSLAASPTQEPPQDEPEQISMLDANAPDDQPTKDDVMGCCALYRECSDAGHCLRTDPIYSARCTYKRHLDAGRIFYGKNATSFSRDEYAKFCAIVDGLPDGARTEYYKMLVYFWCTFACAENALWDYVPALDVVADAGLCKLSPCEDRFLDLCDFGNDKDGQQHGQLRKMLQADAAYGPTLKASGIKGNAKKEVLIRWIKTNAMPFLRQFTGGYTLLSLNPAYRAYSYEYYYDNLRGKEKPYTVELPADRDDFGLFRATR